jgi:hypothetical protein
MLDKTATTLVEAKKRKDQILHEIKALQEELRIVDAAISKGLIEHDGKTYRITGFYGHGMFVEEVGPQTVHDDQQ